MTKKILKPILISIIQIVGLAIFHDSLYYFYPIYNKSVGFGLTIFCTGIIFILSILTFNFYLEFYKKNIYLIALALLTVTSIFPLMTFDYRPLRSLLLIILALCGFVSSLVLTKWKTENKLKTKWNFKKNKNILMSYVGRHERDARASRGRFLLRRNDK